MPESILIVDDTLINRKLTQRVLLGAGYDVRSVEDAEAALHLVPDFHPRMVLTDIRLPGMDGVALARRIKEDPRTQQTLVIALTGCDTLEDRQKALDAGCDDFIIKPIDTRTFPIVIRSHLARQAQEDVCVQTAAPLTPADLPAWAAELCRDFIREGSAKAQELLDLGSRARPDDAKRAAHLWAGLGSTLGYPEITRLARSLENVLGRGEAAHGLEGCQILRRLCSAFSQAPAAAAPPEAISELPASLIQGLSNKKIALIGFDGRDGARLRRLLERAQVEAFDSSSGNWRDCDLVMAAAGAEATGRLMRELQDAPSRPLLLVGTASSRPRSELLLSSATLDFADAPWADEEILTRACRLLTKRRGHTEPVETPVRDRRPAVLIADDDPTTVTLLKTTVQNYEMDCRTANEGDRALAMIRSAPPDVAILDVIMPNMDGFEVLAAIRNDPGLKNVRVILLTALQQENDIVRGFAMGADDYILKPFSPVEVVARLKRLVRERAVNPSERMARCLIYLKALGVALGYVLAVALMDYFYVSRHVFDPGMAFGYSFCLVQGGVIFLLLFGSVAIKFVRHSRERHSQRVQPLILEKASVHMAGGDAVAELMEIRKRDHRDVEQVIADLLSRVHGAARVRLSVLADDLGLVEFWKNQYRSASAAKRREATGRLGLLAGDAGTATLIEALADMDDEIKLEASRSLIRCSGVKEITAVFHTAIRESLLIRAVLTEALRPHALMLCESAAPEALESETAKTVRTALEIVKAWGKSLPLPRVGPLLRHEDAGVRAAALAILPQLTSSSEFESEILRALTDANEGVRAAAAEAAGKLRLGSAMAGLERCLEDGGVEATLAAAYALVRMGPEGCRKLELQVRSSRSTAACAALEAIEQAKSERLALAGL